MLRKTEKFIHGLKRPILYFLMAMAVVVGVRASMRGVTESEPAVIYEHQILYATPDETEMFEWHEGELRRFDFEILYIALDGDIDLKWPVQTR